MTTRCLWHACRALMLGILLMLIGAGMATVGYYANDFALGETKNHTGTVRVKSEQRGLHLNNLSYLGPIVMGVGGEYLSSCPISLRLNLNCINIWKDLHIFHYHNFQFHSNKLLNNSEFVCSL